MIRAATKEDVPEIVRLGSLSLITGPYAGLLKDNPTQSAKFALQVIEGANGKVLLYENDNGKVVGLLGFIIFPHYFTQEPTATEIMWFVEEGQRKEGGALKLLWQAEKEAKEMGATWMGLTAPYDSPVSKIYARFGYRPIETTHMKELRCQ